MWTEIWKRNSISKRSNGGQVLIIWKHFGNKDEKHNYMRLQEWSLAPRQSSPSPSAVTLSPPPLAKARWIYFDSDIKTLLRKMEVLSWNRNMSERRVSLYVLLAIAFISCCQLAIALISCCQSPWKILRRSASYWAPVWSAKILGET